MVSRERGNGWRRLVFAERTSEGGGLCLERGSGMEKVGVSEGQIGWRNSVSETLKRRQSGRRKKCLYRGTWARQGRKLAFGVAGTRSRENLLILVPI